MSLKLISLDLKLDASTLVGKRIECSVIFNARDLFHTRGTPIPQLYVRSCLILKITDHVQGMSEQIEGLETLLFCSTK